MWRYAKESRSHGTVLVMVMAWMGLLSLGWMEMLNHVGVQRKFFLAYSKWQNLHNAAEQGLQQAKRQLLNLPIGAVPQGVTWGVIRIGSSSAVMQNLRIDVVAKRQEMRIQLQAEVLLDNSLCYGDQVCPQSRLRQLWQHEINFDE